MKIALLNDTHFGARNDSNIFDEYFYKTTFKERYISIYWPLKYEIDIRSLKFKYPLALPKFKQNILRLLAKFSYTKLISLQKK